MRKTYTIDELNDEIHQKRMKNLCAIPDFVEKLKHERIGKRRLGPRVVPNKRVKGSERSFTCLKCDVVYHGTNLCPLCDTEAQVNSKWVDAGGYKQHYMAPGTYRSMPELTN